MRIPEPIGCSSSLSAAGKFSFSTHSGQSELREEYGGCVLRELSTGLRAARVLSIDV